MNAVFVKLVNMSVAAGWLILAVLVLRLLLKKAPRWITCLLWAMVAVRLVCPISLQSPVSAYQVAAPTAVQKSGQVEYFHYVYESGDKPSIQLDVDAIRPAEAIPAQPQTTPEQSAAAEPVQETAGRGDPTRYLPPLVTVWLAVGGALLLYGLGSTLRLRLRVREAMRLRDNIWVCDAVTSPFLLGLFRPRVYLPSGMDGAQLDYVLAHEQAHLRRGDHVWKPLGYVLLAAHWFNPLVWLAYWLFCRDIETACDQCVVRRLDRNEKKAYSDALLQCSQGRRMVLACPVAFGEEGVKSRIKAVLQYKKARLLGDSGGHYRLHRGGRLLPDRSRVRRQQRHADLRGEGEHHLHLARRLHRRHTGSGAGRQHLRRDLAERPVPHHPTADHEPLCQRAERPADTAGA